MSFVFPFFSIYYFFLRDDQFRLQKAMIGFMLVTAFVAVSELFNLGPLLKTKALSNGEKCWAILCLPSMPAVIQIKQVQVPIPLVSDYNFFNAIASLVRAMMHGFRELELIFSIRDAINDGRVSEEANTNLLTSELWDCR